MSIPPSTLATLPSSFSLVPLFGRRLVRQRAISGATSSVIVAAHRKRQWAFKNNEETEEKDGKKVVGHY